jgi:small ligand-binding sensory domain FIST
MPRRHGWLQDFEYELDQGDRVLRGRDDAAPSTGPININININLGDLIDKLVSGKKTTREALEEMTRSKRQTLVEDNED